ncbi:hypothetical protein [Massilia sp.]|uniref:hypothetical protein n=1 Tax=Massilia sp. TaxID=1882437 RepID=UPI00352CC111
MKHTEQSQAAGVSNTAFAREMWRHAERGNTEAAKDVREQWKYSKHSEGFGERFGPLTDHEIGAFADRYLAGANGDVIGFARAVERAALVRAYTLLPELRQAEEAKHHRRYFRDGVAWGLATYSGAIRMLAMGQTQEEIEATIPAKPVKPHKSDELAKLERAPGADASRPQFEAYFGKRQFDLTRKDGMYTNIVTAYVWMGWLVRGQDSVTNGEKEK